MIAVILVLALVLGGLALYLYYQQEQMLFFPSREILWTPDQSGMEYREVTFTASDGLELAGWWVPAPGARASVLFLHGNAGNRSGRAETISLLQGLGCNVFIIDYRGYAGNPGRPTERGVKRDVEAAWRKMNELPEVSGTSKVIMGRSLGGALAAWLAAHAGRDSDGVIIESTFTSLKAMAAEVYPWIPGFLVRMELNTAAYVERIQSPVLMGHSREDELIPFSHAETLKGKASHLYDFIEMRGSHGDAFLQTGDLYRKRLDAFLHYLDGRKSDSD